MSHIRVAYFTMEIGLEAGLPTYSGGLGVLAGDTIKAAADLRVPMVGVTLLHRKGYFHQRIDQNGWQVEEPVAWSIDDFLEELPGRVSVRLQGRTVNIRAYRREVVGVTGYRVPVLFLDTDLPENAPEDRGFTYHLYGGDSRYRLCQETILGVGGMLMLREQGFDGIVKHHMNEGHASLLSAVLLSDELSRSGRTSVDEAAIAAVRGKCVFTTHTPVAAGHDRFHADLVREVLGNRETVDEGTLFVRDGWLNMTHLGVSLSGFVNGVSKLHAEVSKGILGIDSVQAVTNGVHTATWASPPMRELFDRQVPGWRQDAAELRNAMRIPLHELWAAHVLAKRMLIHAVNRAWNVGMDVDVFTIGFGRRSTGYKRPGMLFSDLDRLRHIASEHGKIQVVYAGKSHPADHHGKEIIQQIHRAIEALKDRVKVVFMPNYDMALCGLMIAGSDLWLNTPEPPYEASGTSGMKAAVNGVPMLSTLDGWWVEGWIEGVTGWSIGEPHGAAHRPADGPSLYEKLEKAILPTFYGDKSKWASVMRNAISLNGSHFSTHRMMREYVVGAYRV